MTITLILFITLPSYSYARMAHSTYPTLNQMTETELANYIQQIQLSYLDWVTDQNESESFHDLVDSIMSDLVYRTLSAESGIIIPNPDNNLQSVFISNLSKRAGRVAPVLRKALQKKRSTDMAVVAPGASISPWDDKMCKFICGECVDTLLLRWAALCWRQCVDGGREFTACLVALSIGISYTPALQDDLDELP